MSQKPRDNFYTLCLLTFCFLVATISGCRAAPTDGEIGAAQDSRTYYVDAQRGDDRNPGTSREQPWQSIAQVNRMDFAPGDRIGFAGGQTFAGTLCLRGEDSGTQERPVRIGSFGDGRATIDGGTAGGLQLIGCAYVTVSELAFVGCGRKNGNDGNGVELDRTEHVELDSLDVSGFRLSGVAVLGGRNVHITRVDAHDNGFAGVSTSRDTNGARTKDLYIGHCVVRNNPGDPRNLTNHSGNGIVVGGLDGGLVEYCLAFDNGWDMPRQGNGPVGIWGWDCDRLTIQHCISHDNKTASGAADGGGFDLDGGATRSVLQYNLSYHNHGCGYLLCQYPGGSVWKDNICRYNISIDDGLTNHFSGIYFWAGGQDISDAQVYNNVVINDRYAICSTHDIEGLVFRNNVLQARQAAVVGPLRQAAFENNLYHISSEQGVVFQNGNQTFQMLTDWAQAAGKEMRDCHVVGLTGDPKLVLPRDLTKLPADPQQLRTMPFFRLQPDSPCIGSGTVIADNGGQDFFSNPVPASSRPSLGVHEPTR